MNFKVIKQLYKKEILDVLRDKKTIIMMVIVPLLIYPLMFVGGMVMMSKVTTQMDTQTYEIAVDLWIRIRSSSRCFCIRMMTRCISSCAI